MFKGQQTVSFITNLSKKDAFDEIETALATLGNPMVEDFGKITVSGGLFNGFAHETIINGSCSYKESKVNICLNYESKLNVLGWAVLLFSILFFFIGLVVFYFPYSAKRDLENKSKTVLQEIRFQLAEV